MTLKSREFKTDEVTGIVHCEIHNIDMMDFWSELVQQFMLVVIYCQISSKGRVDINAFH